MDSPRFEWGGRSFALFAWTSAMSAWSWSLPAGKHGACPAEYRGEGTICAGCYAQQGRYLGDAVRGSQWARFEMLRAEPDRAFAEIVAGIESLRARAGIKYFRVHDSGDFHALEMIGRWFDVAARFPRLQFWFPTRVYRFPAWIRELQRLATLPNVAVRPSALRFGDPPPIVPGLDAGTMSDPDPVLGARTCPKTASAQAEPSCASVRCRTCWNRPELPVNYLQHGHVVSERERARHAAPVNLTLAGVPL